MKFFKSLRDGFSGNTSHWTRTHNPVVSELVQQANTLSRNSPEIFMRLIAYSHFAVERLVFPEQGDALLSVNVKSISRRQFRKLYSVLLAFLVAKLSEAAPEITSEIKAELLQVVGDEQSIVADQVFEDISGAPDGASESIRLWKWVTDVFNITDKDIQKMFILYASLMEYLKIPWPK